MRDVDEKFLDGWSLNVLREGFESRAIDRFHAPTIEFDRACIFEAKQRSGRHVAHRAGCGGDLRLRKVLDARKAARHANRCAGVPE